MLTLESIIRTTRQESAFGKGRSIPVPRDRAARPRTGRSNALAPSASQPQPKVDTDDA